MPKIFKAGGTIEVSTFVVISGNSTVSQVTSAGGTLPIGISQAGGRTPPIPDVTTSPVEAAQVGEQLQVFALGEECLVTAGATFSAGALLMSDADGKAIGASANKYHGAIALEASGAEDELVLVQVLNGYVGA